MSKNIVICLDGTGNQFKEENSNVVKLFRTLVRNKDQIAYYDAGIGTLADPQFKSPMAKRFSKWFGLGLGFGLLMNVEEAYSYLMEHYEPNDRIFIFGFSRGAYTARVLAGFIYACGLLESGNQNLIPYAIKLFRSRKRPSWIFGRGAPQFEVLTKFKSTFGRSVNVHFLGLWDAVSTFGWIYNPIYLPYTTNNKGIHVVRHALAIDERRSFFQPMPWGLKHQSTQDIKQVWFAGVHSDVGGGYPEKESQLSKIPLKWMIDEATGGKFELLVDEAKRDRYVLGKSKGEYVAPSATADRHESLKGAWWLVQFLPRSVWLIDEEREGIQFPPKHREIEPGATLHRSVIERMAQAKYSPENLQGSDASQVESNYAIEEYG
jgi:uncharacterized protein (DUF2235 family)